MDIKAMSSRSTQTHRLSSLPDCPQMASDPAWTQQRHQVQEDGEAPRSRLSEKLLDFFQVPSEWRTGSDEELLLRLKAREIIGEKVKGRCSESTEAQGKPLLPRPNPKLLPKKAKSPTSDEVTEVCRSAMWQKKEPSKENPQMSGQPSTPGPILGDKWPSSVTSPRQRISGSNLPQNPSSNAGENQTNPHENFTRKTSSKTLLEDNGHLERWYHKATRMAELLTFTPHIDRVKWDWLNNGPTQLPDMKWSGENDTEIFWQWYTTLLGFLTSRGYRGAHYDEIHLDCLIGGLAEPALSHGLKLHEEALLRDKGGKFLEVLDTLMRTYIKEPATLKVTEKYCNVKYNAGKGPRQSYPEPLLNARFLENILPECKEEIIKMGFSSFEEMFRTTSRMDEMKNRLRIAPAYRPECYARPKTTVTANREKPNQAGKEKHTEARANVQDPKPKWKGESSLKQSGNTDQRLVQLVGDRNPRHRIAREVDYKTEGEVGDESNEEEPENISGDFEVEDTSNDFEPEDPNKGPHYSPRRKGEDISVGTTIMAPRSDIIENNDENNTLKLAISQTKKRTTRLPDLHPLHLRSHNLPLPFRYSPSVLATHPLLTSPTLPPSAPILISDRTPPLSPPSYYSAPPSQHLHPPVILLCFPHPLRYSPSDLTTLLSATPSPLPFPSLLPLLLLRHPSAKLRPSTAVPYFALGHRSYLAPSLHHSPYLGL
ncbi:uncharacterized protein EI90DRAFT_3114659 [Cantharellus anzutake]|uniref:uncharacterized protein n=1 Tax=Cantharellus anzutake TaxID=1750568 RepID=UPI0019042364|nr:uncharacterized protein EI90DRAFT_3114659 [Cantharellus anzutake]KAF8344020.1 hypothetical protein EI90DRAFT_3114659 [Cantharellus anzutake]